MAGSPEIKTRRKRAKKPNGGLTAKQAYAGATLPNMRPEPPGTMSPDQQREMLAEDGEVKLFRQHPKTGSQKQFVGTMAVADYSPERVQELYGGGRYRAAVWAPVWENDGWVKRQIKQETFEVDITIPPKSPYSDAEGEGDDDPVIDTAASVSQAVNASVVSLLRSHSEISAIQSQALRDMLKGSNGSSTDWGKVAAVAVPAVSAIIIEMMKRRTDPVAEAQRLAELQIKMMRPESPNKALREALGLLSEVRALSGGGGGDGGEAPWWGALAERGAEALAAIAQARNGQGAAPALGGGEETFTGEDLSMHPAGVQVFGQFREPLIQWAKQGRSPEWVADTVLYEVPDASGLAAWLKDEASIGQVVAVVPALSFAKAWLHEVRRELLARVEGAQ